MGSLGNDLKGMGQIVFYPEMALSVEYFRVNMGSKAAHINPIFF